MPSQTAPADRPSTPDGTLPPGRPGAQRQPTGPDWAAIEAALRNVNWREPRTAWRQIVAQVGLPKLLIGGSVVVLVLVALWLSGGEPGDPLNDPGAALGPTLWIGAVLALVYVSMAALKRYAAGSISQRGTLLEVLDSTTLGPNRSVYVVRAGPKRLVLGVTQNQITPLAELDEDPADAGEDRPTAG